MRRRFRLTGFARFLIVMLFIVPLAYLVASYYRGEDGIQNLKNLLVPNQTSSPASSNKPSDGGGFKKVTSSELQELQNRIDQLEKENRDLKVKIRDLELELKATRLQLENRNKPGR